MYLKLNSEEFQVKLRKEVLQDACGSLKSVSNQRWGSHKKRETWQRLSIFHQIVTKRVGFNNGKLFRVSQKWLTLPGWNIQEFCKIFTPGIFSTF